MLDLRTKPFWLEAEDEKWVKETLAGMDTDAKLGQLFCLLADHTDIAELSGVLRQTSPGGYMFRPAPAAEIRKCHGFLQDHSDVPLLLAANLERGGEGVVKEGTLFASPMQVAATKDVLQARRLGLVCGREAAAVGCNWAFAPVVDIDTNFHNPITNTRTYGYDPELIIEMAGAYCAALLECGVTATIKHWPGDGVDGRDQHLLASINSLSVADWDASFGRVYRALIDQGVSAVMSGHIMQPAYSRRLAPGIADEAIQPGSLAKELLTDLLRGQLGFNGVTVTDATRMVGFTSVMPRELAVPTCIAAGNDMILFAADLQEDLEFMRNGLRRKILTEKRLDEAVTRILALKASLKLHRKKNDGTLLPPKEALSVLGCAEHRRWAVECADKAVTLVKDRQNLLPISPQRHKRILLYVLGDHGGYLDATGGTGGPLFAKCLEDEGFDVSVFDYSQTEKTAQLRTTPIREFKEEFDLVVYLASVKTASNQTVVRLTWALPLGADCPKLVREIPTLFVSIDNPYHLQDVPRIPTFVNAYTSSPEIIRAVVAKLVGKSPFSGISPVDPFCGYWDAHL